MAIENVEIPEKIYFKIGEVCELVGVQAHVLRYWESEFPMLSPQKNKSGQRSYRRRDVEIALRIKQLLYNEMFTIAGAKKKLQLEQRESNKAKSEAQEAKAKKVEKIRQKFIDTPSLFDHEIEQDFPGLEIEPKPSPVTPTAFSGNQQETINAITRQLRDIQEMLSRNPLGDSGVRLSNS